MGDGRSLFRLLSTQQITLILGLVITSIFLYYFFVKASSMKIVILDQETGKEYVHQSIDVNDELIIEWVHSVEKTLWQEKIKITEDGEIMLIETSFESYGSGVPYEKDGTVKIKDGYVILSDLNEVKDNYRWIHSQHANVTIYKNKEILLSPNDIPHHHKVELIVKKG